MPSFAACATSFCHSSRRAFAPATAASHSRRVSGKSADIACSMRGTVAPGGVYLFTPGDFSRSLGRGPAFVDVLLPARDLARRFPRTAGQAPALLEEALGRKPEPGEADAMAAQQAHKAGLITRTGTAGRPTSRHLAHAEHRRRIAVGEAHASLAAEARHLREWLMQIHPEWPAPGVKALGNAIREDHQKHLKSAPKKN